MALDLILFLAGLLLLYYGAGWLVRGSSKLARRFGISPLVIGLTVVAFGTSAPELVVSMVSAFHGKSMIALGNIIGSNICNISLVLGSAAIFLPIACQKSVVDRDIPIMLGVSIYLLIISFNGNISRTEGVSLFGGVVLYSWLNYYFSRKESKKNRLPDFDANGNQILSAPWAKQIFLITVGIAAVVSGAELLVRSAVNMMKLFGLSEKFIGLTVVAFGTSVPELATSVVAAMKKEMDISIGNLIGSNVFNILCVLGAAAMIRPITIAGGFIGSGLLIDYLAMMVICTLPWVMIKRHAMIRRQDGLLLLCCYLTYVIYLIWRS